MRAIGGIQQNACRFQGLRAKNYSLSADGPGLAGRAVNKGDATGTGGSVIHLHMRHNRIGQQGASARAESVFHGGEGAAEVRVGIAAALARPAVMAGCPTIEILGQDGGAADGECSPKVLRHQCAEMHFTAGHLHRRQKMSIGEYRISFSCTADAHIFFNDVVERSEILIRDGPTLTIPIMTCGLEVEVAQSIALPPPAQGSPAQDAESLPAERFVSRHAVRILKIVDEPVVVVFGARIALGLHWPCLAPCACLGEVPILELKCGLVLGEFPGRYIAPGFQQGDIQTSLRKPLRSPAPGGPGTHHDCVIAVRQWIVSHRLSCPLHSVSWCSPS